ncbi:MAG: hypothetical protein AB1792_01565 [Candidatus Zixiibacteriota bacterium]
MRRNRALRAHLMAAALASVAIGAGYTGAETPGPPVTAAAQAPNFDLNWHSINNGGQITTVSPSYALGLSVGQTAAGKTNSVSFDLGIGFWYGVGGGACDCPCHGDPQCDSVANVQDVVQTVNVAFRGSAPVFDPQCPKERTDVNCDGVTTVQDVVKVVNVAFRGYSAATEFCDPCGL